MPVRLFRTIGLTSLGALACFGAAAAVVKRTLPTRGDEDSDELALVAVFDGVKLESRARAFVGGSMLAWFGGIAVDLRGATLAPGAHLRVHSLFGGIAIRVPPDWHVESRIQVLAGGVDVRAPELEGSTAPVLTLDGLVLFGGVSVGARGAEAAFES